MNVTVQIVVWGLVVLVDLGLIYEIHQLRRDMKSTNDALVSIVKTGVIVNAALALLNAANNRRKPGDQNNR